MRLGRGKPYDDGVSKRVIFALVVAVLTLGVLATLWVPADHHVDGGILRGGHSITGPEWHWIGVANSEPSPYQGRGRVYHWYEVRFGILAVEYCLILLLAAFAVAIAKERGARGRTVRWRIPAAALIAVFTVGASLLHVPLQNCSRVPWEDLSVERRAQFERGANSLVTESGDGSRRSAAWLAGEWVVDQHSGARNRRGWIWTAGRSEYANVLSAERIDWRLAWWQPVIGLLIGGALVTLAVGWERRKRASLQSPIE